MAWNRIDDAITVDSGARDHFLSLLNSRVDALPFAYLEAPEPDRAVAFLYRGWEQHPHPDPDLMTVRTEAGWALMPTINHAVFDSATWACRRVGHRDAVLRRPFRTEELLIKQDLGTYVQTLHWRRGAPTQAHLWDLLRTRLTEEEWETARLMFGLTSTLDLPDTLFAKDGPSGRLPA